MQIEMAAPLIYALHRQQATEQRASLEGRRTIMSFIVIVVNMASDVACTLLDPRIRR